MDSNYYPLKEIEFPFIIEQFWNAIRVWITKPHVLNKRILSIDSLYEADLSPSSVNQLKTLVQSYSGNSSHSVYGKLESMQNESNVKVHLRNLIPKHTSHFEVGLEMVIKDKGKNQIFFLNLSKNIKSKTISSICPYMIEFNENEQKIYLKIDISRTECEDHEENKSKNISWLSDVLLPKIIKWAANVENSTLCQESVQLVNINEYSVLYNELKLKYGNKIIEIWPEVTDPKKFVYEDIAIATYLILLWKKQRTSFVDLGCGNGLLVYILNSEGHHGIGIDVRKRKIWDLYPKSTILKVETIVPSSAYLFPHTDWIIGNHSDELTPWIPVITSRSHYNCKMFLLPCCAYQFNGSKYKRINSKQSIYNDYMRYISRTVCTDVCQMNIHVDRLRIPSTKRIAIVCIKRNYSESEYKIVDEKIERFLSEINEKMNQNGAENVNEIKNHDVSKEIKDTTVYEQETRREYSRQNLDEGELRIGKLDESNENSLGTELNSVRRTDIQHKETVYVQENVARLEMFNEKKHQTQKYDNDDGEQTRLEVKGATQDQVIKRIFQTSEEDVECEKSVNKKLKLEFNDFMNENTIQKESSNTNTMENQSNNENVIEKQSISENTSHKHFINKLANNSNNIHKVESTCEKDRKDVRKTWITDIKTRTKSEAVKNCTQISLDICNRIVGIITDELLKRQMKMNDKWTNDENYVVTIEEIVNLVRQEDITLLKQLNKQNGGLKTLIRNNHQLFLVKGNDVLFRQPIQKHVDVKFKKTRPCWFHVNHPFQCPLSEDKCNFSH